MDVIQASKKTLDVAWTIANIPLTIRAALLSVKFGKASGRIKKYRGAHLGETCFVLGGGPSLRDVDMNLLAGRKIISVNMLYRLEAFRQLTPVFHCAIDGVMYRGEVGRSFLDFIRESPDTNFLVSHNATPEIMVQPNVYVAPLGYLPSKACRAFDLSRPSSAFVNSACFAIEAALYLGFSTIVLLGCDFTQFTVRHEVHAYDEKHTTRDCSLFCDLMGHSIAIMHHERLFAEAKRRGVEVFNATDGSMLDVYPRARLSQFMNA